MEHTVNVRRASNTILAFLLGAHVFEIALMTAVAGLAGVIFVDANKPYIFGKLFLETSIRTGTAALDETTSMMRTPIAETDECILAKLQAHLVQLLFACTVAQEFEILESLCTVKGLEHVYIGHDKPCIRLHASKVRRLLDWSAPLNTSNYRILLPPARSLDQVVAVMV